MRILLGAAIISFVISYFGPHEENALPAWIEPCVILTILILNAIVGIYQDQNAEKAIQALKSLQSISALALRNGSWTKVPSKELVPGDVVKFQTGDKVPSDMRLIKQESTVIKID